MIKFDNVSVKLGEKQVLNNISFHIERRDLVTLTGASGTGKTTILRLVAGTLKPDSGTVTVDSNNVGFVFQDNRLLPWKTALDNVTLVLRAQGIPSERAHRQATSWLKMVGLKDYLDYYPAQLSGGMVQRVSIARAFAVEPDIILMDEPFSNLDEQLTDNLLGMLQKVLKNHTATVLYISHDLMEAVRLADRLFYLDEEELLEIPIMNREELLHSYYISRVNAVSRPKNKYRH
ncbi:MAG: ATP-binding cassette domain-containing protein [Dehalococcoidales bacterium]|nr:ATP-binding cassette domain-containing protein [Dehalococcoidales bacterium]